MRLLILILFVSIVHSFGPTLGQTTPGANRFTINGQLANRDTGFVSLWYNDFYGRLHQDSFRLENGSFKFSGSVNGLCEALLWTNLKNRNFDDETVIRFLLEPNAIKIFKKNDQSTALIQGSRSQKEKEDWDSSKSLYLSLKENYYDTLGVLHNGSLDGDSSTRTTLINQVAQRIDSINLIILSQDLKYIKRRPGSYLSGYLLSKQKRKLSVDTLESLYINLAPKVRKTYVAHEVLAYIYPLTNNQIFRQSYPLVSFAVNQQLEKIHSVFDLSLKDTTGKTFNLSDFKGKYLLIDFWGSWCGPCFKNIPALNQIIKEYSSDPIQVISISLDKDLQTWKKSIAKHKFPGLQLSDLKGMESLAAIYCKVLWVPKYILVDQKGEILDYDTPQASEDELKTILNRLLRPANSKVDKY